MITKVENKDIPVIPPGDLVLITKGVNGQATTICGIFEGMSQRIVKGKVVQGIVYTHEQPILSSIERLKEDSDLLDAVIPYETSTTPQWKGLNEFYNHSDIYSVNHK